LDQERRYRAHQLHDQDIGHRDVTNGESKNGAAPKEEPREEQLEETVETPLVDPMEVLQIERDEFKDKLLRTLAEMENLRRRTEKEVSDARSYGAASFARDMLTVVDNLGRGLEAIPADAKAAADGLFKGLIEGVELTERDLLKTLERHGVKRIDPKGEKFDPNRHQALFESPDPATPKGHVSVVTQVGFSIADRVLRPALVGVSTGGPAVDKTV
jgi:molecular chaperone GrpE